MKQTRLILSLLLLFLIGTTATAQNYTISGNVTDNSNGEPLIGATVFFSSISKGTTVDANGRYSISVPKGTYNVTYSFMGFEPQTLTVVADKNKKVNTALSPSSKNIDEITITSQNKQQDLAQPDMGVEKLQASTIKSVPVLLGETDLIKVMQLLPGVQAASEGSTGYSVRGGNPDQNLVLLDGATIYNSGHFMGFFSVFNNDAINDMKLYKGDIPANYGGRLASLLEVNSKDGDKNYYHVNGGVGLISSRLTIDGPIVKDRTSFVASARRTYFDLFLPFAKSESARKSDINFYDLNAKINHKINDNNHLFLSAYKGHDLFCYPIASMEFGNASLSLRWNHIKSDRHYLNMTAHMVNSDYDLGMKMSDATNVSLTSIIKDYSLRAEWNTLVGATHKLSYGAQITNHVFHPGTAQGHGENSMISKIDMPRNKALETALFVSNNETIGDNLTLRYGLRLSSFHNYGPTDVYSYDDHYEVADTTHYGNKIFASHYGLEPRIALSYVLNDQSSVKASYTRSYQYIQQASVSTSGTPMDVWYMSSPNVKPQLSDQVSAGYFINFDDNHIETSIEGFYKNMKHTIDFKDHPHVMFNRFLEGELREGSSRAYGMEMMFKAEYSRWSGWISYTLSQTDRKIAAINNGKRYLSPYNHTHDISVVGSFNFTQRISASANWVFISGAPTTFPVARYEYGGTIVPSYSARNEDRLPNYHRLDMSLTIQCKKNDTRRWKGEWVFSFYNAYSHHNTWAINFQREELDDNTYGYKIKAKSVYLFPIIPSVTYNFKF